MLSDKYGEQIIEHLQGISQLLAIIATDGKTQSEKVVVLLQVGMNPQQISSILGTTPNAVRLIKHKAIKGGKLN